MTKKTTINDGDITKFKLLFAGACWVGAWNIWGLILGYLASLLIVGVFRAYEGYQQLREDIRSIRRQLDRRCKQHHKSGCRRV